jgi:hypothetical protein
MSEDCLIDDATREILQKLSDGDINFSEASDKLGISEKELDNLFEKFIPIISFETMKRLCEMEKETMTYIREMADKNRFPVLVGNCERSCEYCDHVDRGFDEYCHQIYWISERCPLYEKDEFCKQIIKSIFDLAYVTRLTGCIYFKFDEENKRINEEADEQIRQLHERLRLKNEAIAKH